MITQDDLKRANLSPQDVAEHVDDFRSLGWNADCLKEIASCFWGDWSMPHLSDGEAMCLEQDARAYEVYARVMEGEEIEGVGA